MLENYGYSRFVIRGFGARTTNALPLAIGMLHDQVLLFVFLLSIGLGNGTVRLGKC